MAKFNKIQNSFLAGMVSEKFKGRTDFEQYHQACDLIENFVPKKEGGLSKRPGSKFVIEPAFLSSDVDTPVRLIPFIFSNTEAYTVAFALDNTFNPSASVFLVNIFNKAGIKVFNNTLTINRTTDVYGFNFVQTNDVIFITHDSSEINIIRILRNRNDNFSLKNSFETFKTDTNFFLGAGIDKKTVLGIPFLPSNIDAQKNLRPNGTTSGTVFVENDAGQGIAFFSDDHDVDSYFRLRHGTTDGVIKITAVGFGSVASFTDTAVNTGTDEFTVTAHGYNTGDKWTLSTAGTLPAPLEEDTTYFVITTGANTFKLATTSANAHAATAIDITTTGSGTFNIENRFFDRATFTALDGLPTAASATDNWAESAFSKHQGYPRVCTIFESRLVLASTKRLPDFVFNSQANDVYHLLQDRLIQDASTDVSGLKFFGSEVETDAFEYGVGADEANSISWMASSEVLKIGTIGEEFVVTVAEDGQYSNAKHRVRKQTTNGGKSVRAISVNEETLYISRDGRRLRSFKYNRENGSYVSVNMSVHSEDMVYAGFGLGASDELKDVTFIDMVYQPSRETVWLLTSNKKLISFTLSKESQITAWAQHTIDGTNGEIHGITVIPNTDNTFDDLYITVQRTINAVSETYLEKMGDDFEHSLLNNTSTAEGDTAIYLDSALITTLGSITASITGLTHLEGQSVKALAGSTVEGPFTVTAGAITLSQTYPIGTKVTVGYPISSQLRTLTIDAGGEIGTSEGNRKRIDRLFVRLFKSRGGSYGHTLTPPYSIEYANAIDLFTGGKRLDFEVSPDEENQIVIAHSDPVPFNILSITYRGVSYD